MPDAALCPRPDKIHFFTKEVAYRKRSYLRGPGQQGELAIYQCACGLWTLGRDPQRRKNNDAQGS